MRTASRDFWLLMPNEASVSEANGVDLYDTSPETFDHSLLQVRCDHCETHEHDSVL